MCAAAGGAGGPRAIKGAAQHLTRGGHERKKKRTDRRSAPGRQGAASTASRAVSVIRLCMAVVEQRGCGVMVHQREGVKGWAGGRGRVQAIWGSLTTMISELDRGVSCTQAKQCREGTFFADFCGRKKHVQLECAGCAARAAGIGLQARVLRGVPSKEAQEAASLLQLPLLLRLLPGRQQRGQFGRHVLGAAAAARGARRLGTRVSSCAAVQDMACSSVASCGPTTRLPTMHRPHTCKGALLRTSPVGERAPAAAQSPVPAAQ